MTESILAYADFNYHPSEQLNPYPHNRHPFHLTLTTDEYVPYIPFDKFYYFIHLPRTLQISILSNLNLRDRVRTASSCKLLRKLIMSPDLWEELNIVPYYDKISNSQLSFLCKLGKDRLTKVNFRGCLQVDGGTLWHLGTCCPKLEQVNLSGCYELTGTNLTSFFFYTTNLTHLNLSGLNCLTPVTLSTLSENCIQLNELNLNWCKNGSDRSLHRVLSSCQKLTKLHINGWKHLSYSTLVAMGSLVNLTHLDMQLVTGLPIFRSNDNHQVYNTTLEGLTINPNNSIKRWTYLNLSQSSLVNEVSFNQLIVQCPYLTWLDISYCNNLKLSNLDIIAFNCLNLTHLSLEDTLIATDLGLRKLSTSLTKLKWLNLGFNNCIKDEGVGRLLRALSNLSYLSVEGCEFISDELLIELPKWIGNSHRLECVNVNECKLITSGTVEKFQRGYLYPYSLKLSRVKLLSSFDYIDPNRNQPTEAGGLVGELSLTSCTIL